MNKVCIRKQKEVKEIDTDISWGNPEDTDFCAELFYDWNSKRGVGDTGIQIIDCSDDTVIMAKVFVEYTEEDLDYSYNMLKENVYCRIPDDVSQEWFLDRDFILW